MAQTSYISLDSATEEKYYSALQSGDRFIFPRVHRKIATLSRTRRKGVTARSLLPQCSALWQSFTLEEKTAWNNAGIATKLSGWKLFVKDQCYRIVNFLEGVATPTLLRQALCGQIHVGSPDAELKIFQPHPYSYYVNHKITGKKGMYEPVAITERLILPLEIGLSYKSNLTQTDGDGYAKFYAIVRRLYQGRNIDTVLEIDLDLSSDWREATATLSNILGQYTSYALYFHLYHVTGDLFFDNIKAIHNAQNWARDPSCNDVNQEFTKAFYQIPKHWAPLIMGNASFYESIYPI